ncbi:MAG: hypothetical protein CMF46_00800 [Legionellales bacterium]|nr:hypothetical protein [Legionellales bacterium]
MARMLKKTALDEKICPVCKRPFKWRKRWEKVWSQVKYCSERCRQLKRNIRRNS